MRILGGRRSNAGTSRLAIRGPQATARAPMGSNKRDHIKAIMFAPHVAKAWAVAHAGAEPNEADVDALYAAFTPIQIEVVRTRSDPIPGAEGGVGACCAAPIPRARRR